MSFLHFLKQLLTVHWRSLLLLLLGVYLPLQVFGQIAIERWQDANGFAWDESLLLAIHGTAKAQLDVSATILTKFGVSWGVIPATAAIAIVFLVRRRWRSLLYLLITMLGSGAINRTVKVSLHQMRPQLWVSPTPEIDFGFPSGHAMSSMSFVAALVILTWGSRWCLPILFGGSAFVISIGWTRLYLGVHFPSDILAGWLVSLAWAIGVSILIKPNLTPAIALDQEPPTTETTLLPEETAVSKD